MRNKNNYKYKELSYYAKILFVVGLTFLIYGCLLDVRNTTRLIDPVKDVEVSNKSTINITTSDNSEVVPGNTKESDTNSTETIKNNPVGNISNNNTNNTGNDNSNNRVNNIDVTNNNLRNRLEERYGITIRYGSETDGYTVGDISTTPIRDSNVINSNLNKLSNALSLYPNGFFAEIKSGGIPLTIILINNYNEYNITGVTDSNYNYATISIAVSWPLEASFYHESYHYIERYMFKRGANFNTWNSLNPRDFSYGSVNDNYSYANTYSAYAPFVNEYAETSPEEDRASTFEYMMAQSKALCLNNGMTVWKKANVMAETIDTIYNSVSPSTTEYWERFL